jgi:hypothetical protein
MRPRVLIAFLLTLAAAAAACSSSSNATDPGGDDDDDDDNTTTVPDASTPPADSGLSILHLSPSREYSGFDGTHSFKVPIAVYGAKSTDNITVTPDVAGAAVITPVKLKNVDPSADSGVYFMVDIKQAGTIKLTAKAGTQTADATISVAQYEAARWTQGETRYMNAGSNGDPACRSCHVDGQAIDHSPATLASVADTDVGRIMTLGVKPSRATISTGCTDCSDAAKKHQWMLSDDERRGLIVYLRGLEPRGFE